MGEELIYIKSDIEKTSTGNTVFYKMGDKLKEFIEQIEKETEVIEAVILTRRADKSVDSEIGFICGKEKI